jgi:thiol-disulfide isomerase/thioredoxin
MPQLMIRFLLVWAATAAHIASAWPIDIGSRIGSFQSMPTVSGPQSLDLSTKLVVFIFWSFKCPVSLAYDDRVNELQDKYGNKKVVVFGVASAANETKKEIRANTANLNLKVPVLWDSEGSFAEMLGATRTPSVFIFDENKVLRYKGALDNNKKAGESGRVAYVEDALDAILAARPVTVPETRAFGCGIKRRGIKE